MSTSERGLFTRGCSVVVCFTLIAGMLLLAHPGHAQSAGEYQVKAAFILNFARFIEWPNDALRNGDTLVIGVIGNDPFGNSIDQIVSRGNANGRRLVVRRMKWNDDLRSCQILFVSASERRRVNQILDAVRGAGILTISDMSDFNRLGGMIKFFIQGEKVFFEINAAAAVQARLKVSSKLMALSKGER